MSPHLTVWLEFATCGAIIAFAGNRLSRYGDVIAEKTGLSGSWVGLMLLATVTSLPELITGVSSVTLADVPDIAVGNILGACVINLAMIVVLDFLYREESVYTRASHGHILSAAFGVAMLGFVGTNMLIAERLPPLAVGHMGLYTPIIALLYIVALRMVFLHESKTAREFVAEAAARYPDITLAQAATGYAVAAAAVVGAGIWLPFIGERLAAAMGWQQSFVGTMFVALATTLPEISVTLGALRVKALDMAIGNLLGSNLFNVFILAIDDVAYLKGPLLSHVSPVHLVSALSATVMSGVAIIGVFYRPRTRLFRTVGWASFAILLMYLLNAYTLFLLTG